MIRIKEVCKSFGEQKVLDRVSLTIPEGEITCLMGTSGSGKTTLLRILMGLIPADAGEVTGVPERIAAVFQEDRLLPEADAVRNVCVTTGASRSKVREHFARVGLTEYEGKPAADLSGGMMRRVAIVRACLADAKLVVMDEPFKGLDEETRDLVIAYVREECAGKTLLVVTHLPEEAEKLGGTMVWLDQLTEPAFG